jgi:signal transduction histidine kinase
MGHVSANDFFLLLLVAWVGVVGTRAELTLAVGLALAVLAIGVGAELAGGTVLWTTWISWTVGLLMVCLMALLVRRQEQLLGELGVLLSVSRWVASRLEMSPLLDTVLDALSSVMDYTSAMVLTLDDAGETLAVAHWRAIDNRPRGRSHLRVAEFGELWTTLARDEPIVIGDLKGDQPAATSARAVIGDNVADPADGRLRSLMWVPLVVRGQIIGILSVAASAPGRFDARDAVLALGIARQAAVAIENARLHERARQAAILEERQRLARELHDSVTQSLYGISLYAEAAGRALADGETEPAAANVREISETTREALGETRLLLFELRPPLLEEQGLGAALRTRLQAVEARAGLEVKFDCQGHTRLAPDREVELFRLSQEALNNVLKHAHAHRVQVNLDLESNPVVLDVADDGVGFDPTLHGAGGLGVPGMRERAERLGGTLRIESAPGNGTRVHVEVPR